MTWNYANEYSLKSAPPNQFQGPQGVQYQVAPNQFQPGQTVIVPNGFDSSARFNNGTASIPPPPPGHVPNAAQVAASQGANVQIGQKKESFLTGGEGGGYTMWWIKLERTRIFLKNSKLYEKHFLVHIDLSFKHSLLPMSYGKYLYFKKLSSMTSLFRK